MTKKKRRDLYAREVLDRTGPYKPKIIQTKKKHQFYVAGGFYDDWYFDYDRGFYDKEEDSDD